VTAVRIVGITLPLVYLRYTLAVIRSFRHKGLEAFFQSGSKAGIQPKHAIRLRLQLSRLHRSDTPAAMGLPGWRLHPLTGRLAGHWSVHVSKNWCLTFGFDGRNVVDVDYLDYH